MSGVLIQLQLDTERRLAEQAQKEGQTLETYIAHLVEHKLSNGQSHRSDELEEDELLERPWRGVLVLPYPWKEPLNSELPVLSEPLPGPQQFISMAWHRTVSDDE